MTSTNQTQTELAEIVQAEFESRYDRAPQALVRAPGRVNLIGEHTDYNDGFVLPLAIDRAVWIALEISDPPEVKLYSTNFEEYAAFGLEDYQHNGPGWIEYLKGVAWALAQAGYELRGWRGVIGGNVPRGAGLSSSAAVELAAARAFAVTSGFDWQPAHMAQLAQRAENQWVGVNCGIMDQMISAVGVSGHAVLIDCRSLETTAAPLPSETVVVVLDTATRRGLVNSAYNERRSQCEAAARFFGVPALRDVDLETFSSRADDMEPLIRRRARHVVAENQRTLDAVEAMRQNAPTRLGLLMNSSHASLRDDFEVSRWELDLMVNFAQQHPACYGARMTGGGFGGCAVALVARQSVASFSQQVAEAYQQASGLQPRLYVCEATDGAEIVFSKI